MAAAPRAVIINRMLRAPVVPAQLRSAPFTVQQAALYGVTREQLRGMSWRRVGLAVFASNAVADSALARLRAASLRLPAEAAFSDSTGGWLYGMDTPPCDPIEATILDGTKVTRRAGIKLHRSDSFETSTAHGLPVTCRVRTVADLARRQDLVEAVVMLDMALHRRVTNATRLRHWADTNRGRRGVAVLGQALELTEPATESPMETRLRLALVLAGLPRPTVQPTLRDESGTFLARPDLYYPGHRLAIEYDGATHKDSIAGDNRRQNRLLEAGYRILRFTASDVLGNPSGVVSLVRRAIARPPDGL